MNFLKMALIRVRFSLGFPLGAGLPAESNLITVDHVGENRFFADRVVISGGFPP
jgi:hypothetical protein